MAADHNHFVRVRELIPNLMPHKTWAPQRRVLQHGQVTYEVVYERQEPVGSSDQCLPPAAGMTHVLDKIGRVALGDWLFFILHGLTPASTEPALAFPLYIEAFINQSEASMSKAPKRDKLSRKSMFDSLFEPSDKEKGQEIPAEQEIKPPEPKPSLQTIGMTDCSVCGTELSVVLTRTGHPFTVCGKCGARTFFNSHVAIEILKQKMRGLDHD
jgi:hypothetical protein